MSISIPLNSKPWEASAADLIEEAHNASRQLNPSSPPIASLKLPEWEVERFLRIYAEGTKLLAASESPPRELRAKLIVALKDLKKELLEKYPASSKVLQAVEKTFVVQNSKVENPVALCKDPSQWHMAIDALHYASRRLLPSGDMPKPSPESITEGELRSFCDDYLRGESLVETSPPNPNSRATLQRALKDLKKELEPVAKHYYTSSKYWEALSGSVSSSDLTPHSTRIIVARKKEKEIALAERQQIEEERRKRDLHSKNSLPKVYLPAEQNDEGSMSSASAASASSSTVPSSQAIDRCYQAVNKWGPRAKTITIEVLSVIAKILPSQTSIDPSKFTKIDLQDFCDTYIKGESVRNEWENLSSPSDPSLLNTANGILENFTDLANDPKSAESMKRLIEGAAKARMVAAELQIAMLDLLKAMNPIAKFHDGLREPATGISSWTRWIADPFKDSWWYQNAAQTAIAERKKVTQPRPADEEKG